MEGSYEVLHTVSSFQRDKASRTGQPGQPGRSPCPPPSARVWWLDDHHSASAYRVVPMFHPSFRLDVTDVPKLRLSI